MSTHPNAILLLTLTPEDLSRKTWRNILQKENITTDDDIKIGEHEYRHKIMESDYEKGYQISAQEGDIIVFDMITYGYGELIKWQDLEKQKQELEKWAKDICDKFQCSYQIFITANYW